jgi:hypothetical protein
MNLFGFHAREHLARGVTGAPAVSGAERAMAGNRRSGHESRAAWIFAPVFTRRSRRSVEG